MKYVFSIFTLCIFLIVHSPVLSEIQKLGPLSTVPAIPIRSEWNQFKILVWQYQTSVLKDIDLYRQAGLGGFHIDRGAGKSKLVDFSIRERLPYYVDHVADKGFLYLKGNNAEAVTGKRSLATRPHSLAAPKTIEKLKQHIAGNISVTKNGLVLAYSFDDEISLGSFVTPCDVDKHPLSIAWFRKWLRHQYKNISALNKVWGSHFNSFDEVMPKSFDQVRGNAWKPPLSQWNLAPWMDFRHFMDFQFAAVLAELTRYSNSIDPKIPA
ncbi:MAG: beta-galactosidase, partial [Deltaproteobacteria bacterium]|nr:beta-galactosidase [Deltaproteobacteria bacterium]